jgi:hypothetical protein
MFRNVRSNVIKPLGTSRANAAKQSIRRDHVNSAFGKYEELKASLTAIAATPAEYEAACRQAAKIAGV